MTSVIMSSAAVLSLEPEEYYASAPYATSPILLTLSV